MNAINVSDLEVQINAFLNLNSPREKSGIRKYHQFPRDVKIWVPLLIYVTFISFQVLMIILNRGVNLLSRVVRTLVLWSKYWGIVWSISYFRLMTSHDNIFKTQYCVISINQGECHYTSKTANFKLLRTANYIIQYIPFALHHILI